ncbi:MAG TPA: metallophosphoesterase [Aliidongia sp.]|nr:metallophosphoesterase [Aliidongia sp.]
MTRFFTSDTHFGHGGAMALYRRPFASVAAMDAAMIENWNRTVGPEDEIWHLGDFAIRPRQGRIAELLGQLNGIKHLITGNNDPAEALEASGWTSVGAYAELMEEGRRVVLCHYAFRTWRDMAKGAIDLHGHSHGRLAGLPRQWDVGVDAWDFRPITLAEIMASPKRNPAGKSRRGGLADRAGALTAPSSRGSSAPR